jgi:nucleoside-diphosphate-sugar epimerase
MRILITGATGYIGSAVTEALERAGHELTALARSEEAAARLAAQGVRAVRGDLADIRRVAELSSQADGVVWVATSNREETDAPAVAAILARLAGTGKTFLYTSGSWVHGNTQGVADESSPLAPAELVAWRVSVEKRVLTTSGVRGLVIRPGIVYGRGGGIPSMLSSSVLTHRAARYVGTGENRWAMVFIDDLSALYRKALEHAPLSSVLLGVQGPSVSVVELARAASVGLGARGRVLSWPIDDARRGLGAFADALTLDQQLSSKRAERRLDWKPQGPSPLDELRRGSYAQAFRLDVPASGVVRNG